MDRVMIRAEVDRADLDRLADLAMEYDLPLEEIALQCLAAGLETPTPWKRSEPCRILPYRRGDGLPPRGVLDR